MRTCAQTLPNPEALGPEIEDGAVNQHPLQALFLLPRGGTWPATGPGAIYLQIMCYVRGVGYPRNPRTPAVAIRRPIGHGGATNQRRETPTVTSFSTSNGAIPRGGTGGRRHCHGSYLKVGRADRKGII